MSANNYNGRRGPNVSQYIRNLNAINPEEATTENFEMGEDDLALFTNTQFFDFETGQNTDYQAQPVKVDVDATPTTAAATTPEEMTPAQSVMGDLSMDFNLSGDFNFTDFATAYPPTPLNGFADGSQSFQPLPNPSTVYSQIPPQQHQHFAQPAPRPAAKAKDGVNGGHPINFEEASRHAAEEDKRRRNTAASARFRIKKKQREQALEKSAKDLQDKVSSLESKVTQLEMENKWLKGLLVEKNEGNDDIVTLWKEFASKQAASKKTSESKQDDSVKEESR